MIRPGRSLFIGLIIWLLLAIAASIVPAVRLYWQSGAIVLLVLAILDAWRVRRVAHLTLERHISSALAVGVWREVQLTLHHQNTQEYTLSVFDHHPPDAVVEQLPQKLTLPAATAIQLRYRFQPQRRGHAKFSGVSLLWHSPWRIWQYYQYYPLVTVVRIYPNFATLIQYTLLATENRLGQLGIRKHKRRGEGLEFHQLREYQFGDSLRQIDWNTTSRYKKLISKEYQDERDQNIILLLDCGRRMLAQDGPLSHFDHTLNAILLLAYVALRQGDALGLLTFSGEHRWLAPSKGCATVQLILKTLYDLQPSTRTSDYLTAAQQLIRYQRKRALIVLISNLRDEDSDELLPALRLLQQKHLVLLASLQEQILNTVLAQPVHTFDAALRHAALDNYLAQRRHTHKMLRAQGIFCLDTPPEHLPIMMVNRYLDIKRSGRL
ncbi:MAG: DUF58 domain-containing protein [Pseudomonadota bacterium]|nr:DUF58 domain-containing protein [Pseudomonadota bacterium]